MGEKGFCEGIELNLIQKGLLNIGNDLINTIIKSEPITNLYDVEHTPFARGKFAAVRRCRHKVTGVSYAAKFIRKRRRSMDRQDILHEVAVLHLASFSRCPKIVRLHDVFETPTEMAIVLELAAGGELQTIVDLQEGLEEREAIIVMRQILQGLEFLHNHNIAHLDLKPQNLLLATEYPELDITLCDFGISRVIQGGVEVREILGTPDYVAPEILSYEPISLATDIWSVGVLAYVLLSGYSPFAGDNKQETFCNISQCNLSFPEELFDGVSETAKHFIQATLRTKPGLRLNATECLSHPWLSSSPVKPILEFTQTATVLNNDDAENGDNDLVEIENGDNCCPNNDSPARRSYQVVSCLSCSQCGSQCCQQHSRRNSVANSPVVEIVHDRGIIC